VTYSCYLPVMYSFSPCFSWSVCSSSQTMPPPLLSAAMVATIRTLGCTVTGRLFVNRRNKENRQTLYTSKSAVHISKQSSSCTQQSQLCISPNRARLVNIKLSCTCHRTELEQGTSQPAPHSTTRKDLTTIKGLARPAPHSTTRKDLTQQQ